MQGRLNIFQRTMLQWNDLHPYNAIHVVRVPEPLDVEHLRISIGRTLQSLGLSRLNLDRKAGRVRYEAGPAGCETQILSGEADPRRVLSAEIERQLNLAFPQNAAPFEPFRFFAVSERDSFSLGLVYFHPVADAEPVALLLRDIVQTYLAANHPAPPEPFHLEAGRTDRLLRHPGQLARKLGSLPAFLSAIRSSRRLRYSDPNDQHNGFACYALEPEILPRLLRAAKSWGVTLNDLFLALLLKSVSSQPAGRVRGRRRNISVGCIVNIRKNLQLEHRRTFGVFLGSFVVTHEVPDGADLRQLAGDIHRQTLRIKQGRLYLGTPLEMALGRWLLSLFSTERRKKLYQKHYPLWGGVTNMNMNSLWEPSGTARPLDYLRAVSTGPVTPLVLSVTTAGDRVNVGLTFRTTVFSAGDIERLKNHFQEALAGLEVRV
jgi:NRPS condensation-like uncharacterized protein